MIQGEFQIRLFRLTVDPSRLGSPSSNVSTPDRSPTTNYGPFARIGANQVATISGRSSHEITRIPDFLHGTAARQELTTLLAKVSYRRCRLLIADRVGSREGSLLPGVLRRSVKMQAAAGVHAGFSVTYDRDH